MKIRSEMRAILTSRCAGHNAQFSLQGSCSSRVVMIERNKFN